LFFLSLPLEEHIKAEHGAVVFDFLPVCSGEYAPFVLLG
jgi:hypothetical protein